MIFDFIKNMWLRKQVKKLLMKPRVGNNQKPKSLVVFYDADVVSSTDFIKNWAQGLGIENVSFAGFTANVKREYNDEYRLVNLKMIKAWGGVKEGPLKQILDQKFDLQINYFITSTPLLSYAAAAAQAAIKVGLPQQEQEYYDLAIAVSLDQKDVFFTELKKYLNIITK